MKELYSGGKFGEPKLYSQGNGSYVIETRQGKVVFSNAAAVTLALLQDLLEVNANQSITWGGRDDDRLQQLIEQHFNFQFPPTANE